MQLRQATNSVQMPWTKQNVGNCFAYNIEKPRTEKSAMKSADDVLQFNLKKNIQFENQLENPYEYKVKQIRIKQEWMGKAKRYIIILRLSNERN